MRNYLAAFLACGFLFADTGRIAEAVREAGDYYRQGKHAEAEKATAEALSLIDGRRGPPDFEVAEGLNTLGALVYSLGDLERAGQLFQRSRQAYQALVAPDDPRLAVTLYNLAGVLVEKGRYPQALALYRNALEIREKTLGAGSPLVAEVCNDLGFVSLREGNFKEA